MPDRKGYVYILTNPSFREDWVKIGKSIRPVDVRSKELDNTAVPLPFEIYATLETVKFSEAEKMVHGLIDELTDLRIRKTREFFNVSPQKALGIFRRVTAIIDDAKVTIYRDNKPIEEDEEEMPDNRKQREKNTGESAPRRERFKFSMVGVKKGEKVTFTPTGLEVKVAGDDSVEYRRRVYKLSPFVRAFMPEEKRNSSGAYQGAKYFSYHGKLLDELRTERERQAAPPEESDEEVTEEPIVETVAEPAEKIVKQTVAEPAEPAAEISGENEPAEKPIGEARPRRGRFKFSMVGVKKGEKVTFTPTGIEVKVAGDDAVEYRGRVYKLSPFVRAFMPEEKRNSSGAYQGAKFFTYQGRTLDELRTERERQAAPLEESDEEVTEEPIVEAVAEPAENPVEQPDESLAEPIAEISGENEPAEKPTGEARTHRGPFKFHMIGVQKGETLIFVPTGIEVRVASDDSVEYRGRMYKLSPFVRAFMPEGRRNSSGAYQGPKFFTYQGRTLDELRTERERRDSGRGAANE